VLIAETHGNGAFGGDWAPDVVAEAFGRVNGGPPVDVYSHRLPQIDFLSVALPRCLPQTLHHLSDAVRTT
jgi:hypothetical protein